MKESVEDFLKRGGKVQTERTETTLPIRVKNDYSDKEFENTLHNFYNSREWKDLRISVKKELTPMCPVCGSEDNLHVDHIRPIRHFFEERLDPNNLQILCGDCNIEKGSMLNWTLEWHIKNKNMLMNERIHISLEIHRKQQRKDNLHANTGLEGWEQTELTSCYASYLSRCKGKKIQPVSKYDLRRYIEENMKGTGESPWRYGNAIKRHIKEKLSDIKPI
jgi:hypothetical protein